MIPAMIGDLSRNGGTRPSVGCPSLGGTCVRRDALLQVPNICGDHPLTMSKGTWLGVFRRTGGHSQTPGLYGSRPVTSQRSAGIPACRSADLQVCRACPCSNAARPAFGPGWLQACGTAAPHLQGSRLARTRGSVAWQLQFEPLRLGWSLGPADGLLASPGWKRHRSGSGVPPL